MIQFLTTLGEVFTDEELNEFVKYATVAKPKDDKIMLTDLSKSKNDSSVTSQSI